MKTKTKKAFPILILSIILAINLTTGFIYSVKIGMENSVLAKGTREESLETAYFNTSAALIDIDGDAHGVGANNWTWAQNQPWCSGSGSWGDPFIIANLSINGQNNGSCIKIEDSDVFFRIQNCTLYNSSRLSYPDYYGGIELEAVENGIIENCTIYDNNGYGISVWRCTNITMKDNIINNDDIWNYYSDYNSILDNTFTDVDPGIWVASGSSYTTVARNTFVDSNDGISHDDNYIEILNNTFINCDSAIVAGGHYNTISNNSILSCGSGISFQSGSNNTIMYNEIKNGDQESYSIRLFKSSNFNNVSYNIIINNSADGIVVRNSKNNTLYNNTIKENARYGVNLYQSNYTIVSYNIVINNTDGCFNEDNCFGNVFANNICIEVPSEGNGEEPLIFGYNIYILVGLLSISSLILISIIVKKPNK